MKVVLLGATGNLGSRLVPALLTHGHTVVTLVRSSKKLESLLPPSVFQQITVIEGDASNSSSIKKVILDSKCDAVVNTAGNAALAPWKKGGLPVIFRAVVDAVRQAGEERGSPLRVWLLAGLGMLYCPGTKSLLADYIPIYLEHRQDLQLLRSLPSDAMDWSLLCPSDMDPESSDFSVPTKSSQARLTASAGTPPLWRDSWVKSIPLLGTLLSIMQNASRYGTTLEQNADFIAADLETRDSPWIGTTVGIIDGSK